MTQVDTEKFRLRRFVEKLAQEGECTVHDDPIDLIDVAAVLDCNPKAVWFRAVGPERAELVGNVMGARRRLAAALDTDEPGFPATLRERLEHPAAPIEVSSAQAPVHEVVLTGEQADLTALPVHLQHGLDGAPYISASIDYARDPRTGFTNIGCRRLMLRGPRAAATRFQADRDFVMASGFRCVPLDPSLQGSRTGAKAGFDCTKPFGKGDSAEFRGAAGAAAAAARAPNARSRAGAGPGDLSRADGRTRHRRRPRDPARIRPALRRGPPHPAQGRAVCVERRGVIATAHLARARRVGKGARRQVLYASSIAPRAVPTRLPFIGTRHAWARRARARLCPPYDRRDPTADNFSSVVGRPSAVVR